MTGLQIASMILSIIFMLAGAAGFGYSIYKSVSLVKDKRASFDMKPYFKHIGIGLIVWIFAFTVGLTFIFAWNGYDASIIEWLYATFGSLLFTASFGALINSFIIHYYGKGLGEVLDKTLFRVLISSIPVMAISFFLVTNGFADVAGPNFLFPNGLNFSKGFVRPDSVYKPNLAFYAICILFGAGFVYFLSDHYMYKEYGKHGTLESTFFVAFPAGILGARIAYVIGNWTKDGFDQRVAAGEWWSIFAMWEGGLTILGGAIAGIIAGVLVYIKVNKGRSIWKAVDLIVPTILIAQAFGRWGNFFNCEVHGVVYSEAAWTWLPKIIFNNAHYSSSLGWAPEGSLYVPLFFIEFITNLFGYFVIAHVFGKKLSKILRPGDLCFGYIIWYGLTRVFMEPLRHPSFMMGDKDFWSWGWAIVFVVFGSLAIMVNHIVRHYLAKKKGAKSEYSHKINFISGGIVAFIGLALLIPSIILMANNEFVITLEYNAYNIGIILLALSVSFFFISAPCFVEGFDKENSTEVSLDA